MGVSSLDKIFAARSTNNAFQPLEKEELRRFLVKNWMTHDGLWYGEVAGRFGMAEAAPMSVRVCRKLGQTEFSRLMKLIDASRPKDFGEYKELFEFGMDVFVPDFVEFKIEYPGDNSQVFHFLDCFAHKSMQKAELLPEYECGIFVRIEGWFNAMGLNYVCTPDLSRCLKFTGEECTISVKFRF